MDPRLADMPRNRMRVKPRFPEICPCGCKLADMNDKGYCKHLVGWTLDRKIVELRETFGTGQYERCGVETRPIDPKNDIIVEMETMTARVYQTQGDPLVTKVPATDNDALMALLQEQSAEIEKLKKRMAESAETRELALA